MPEGIPATLTVIAVVYLVWSGYLILLATRPRRASEADDGSLFFVLVIPALNEELVLGNTIRHLLRLPGDNYLVLVTDDDSDDSTAGVVSGFPPEKVRLVSRRAPSARLGKGAALNHAYRVILTSELPERYGADHVVMVVMDADGQVQGNLLTAVAPAFSDPQIAAVQVGVRMLNAKQNLLTRWQQYEFVTFNWIFSRARNTLGSVSLGGNGQFVRLSALVSLGGDPWTDCLTEDLDIGLRLRLRGWRNLYCHDTCVFQQAVPELKRLVRQRSRWFQGHIQCWRHAPRVMLADDMSSVCKADILHYLLVPALVLPIGLLSIISLGFMAVATVTPIVPVPMPGFSLSPAALLSWYILGLGLVPIYALAMWRDRQSSIPGSLFWAHLFTLGSYIWVAAGCMAVKRMAWGRGGWLKTARVALGPVGALVESRPQDRQGPYLAQRLSVHWREESHQLLPVRSENFVPRHSITTALVPYSPPLGPSRRRASSEVMLARAEAHMDRLEEVLRSASTWAPGSAAAPRGVARPGERLGEARSGVDGGVAGLEPVAARAARA